LGASERRGGLVGKEAGCWGEMGVLMRWWGCGGGVGDEFGAVGWLVWFGLGVLYRQGVRVVG